MTVIDIFRAILRMNKKGRGTGIYSVCSAHETVLKASMMQAKEDSSIVLIESTSNQVNQDGGYTGMRPQDFVDYVSALAQEMEFDSNMILLGGDHLGLADVRMDMSECLLGSVVFFWPIANLPAAQTCLRVARLLPTVNESPCPGQCVVVVREHCQRYPAIHQRRRNVDE